MRITKLLEQEKQYKKKSALIISITSRFLLFLIFNSFAWPFCYSFHLFVVTRVFNSFFVLLILLTIRKEK